MASSLTKDSAEPLGYEKTFLGHPRGLATLFMTEMWERFSYYGMRALLVLYLVSGGVDAATGSQGGGLAMTAATATAIYSVYVSMVYLMAMPGGWFGDRVWGARKTVAIAASVIMLGHVSLAVPGQAMFFVGLALVAVGSGLLKANISTMVGHLYKGADDPRRDGGFTLFYVGINLGAFFAPLVIGTVGEKVNWHLGFALAAVGMGLGTAVFLIFGKTLNPKSSEVPNPLSAEERKAVITKAAVVAVVVAVFYGAVVAMGMYTLNWAMVPITLAGLIIPVAVLARIKRDKDLDSGERSRVTGYIWFFVAAAIFWMIYDQGGSTLSLFADDKTMRHDLRPRLPRHLVPVAQPAVRDGAGSGVRLAVAVAGPQEPGAEHHREVRDGSGPRRRVLLRLHRPDEHGGRRHQGLPDVAGHDLHDPDHR